MKRKTNFEFMNTIEKNYDVIESNIFTHRALTSMINQLEDKLYNREYSNKNIEFRFICELIIKYWYNELKENSKKYAKHYHDSYQTAFEYWEKKTEEKFISEKARNKSASRRWGGTVLADALYKAGIFGDKNKKKEEDESEAQKFRDKYVEFNKMCHSSAHLIDFSEMENEVKGKFINGVFTLEQTTYKKYIDNLESLHELLIKFMDHIYPIKGGEFNKEIYRDGRSSLIKAIKEDDFATLIKEDCSICKEGTLEIPKDNFFMHGAFLECNKCHAILSLNLNLKSKEVIRPCKKPNCVGQIKQTSFYNEDIPEGKEYRDVYEVCNLCKDKTKIEQKENQ